MKIVDSRIKVIQEYDYTRYYPEVLEERKILWWAFRIWKRAYERIDRLYCFTLNPAKCTSIEKAQEVLKLHIERAKHKKTREYVGGIK